MKVLHISTSDRGGAANAAIRLHQALLKEGIDSKFLVLKKFKNYSETYKFREAFLLNRSKNFWNRLLKETKFKIEQNSLKGQPKGFEIFSYPDSWFDIRHSKLFQQADIINLHWVAGFLDYQTFFRGHSKKIIWTLHDMNPFTGGCHYSSDCQGFMANCSACPQLSGTNYPFLARKFFEVKKSALESANLSIVAPSVWLSDLAKNSALFGQFPNFCIPYSLDFEIFKRTEKREARQILNLPASKKILFFTAQDTANIRKGFQFLYQALPALKDENLVVFTAGKKAGFSVQNTEIIEAGTIESAEKMALAYSASDVFVIPSLEDNLPNTVLESLACGTPVVGFRIGGIPDMVKNGQNGMLADEISSSDLAKTLHYVLNHLERFDTTKIMENCQKTYAPSVQAQGYLALYEEILQK